MNLFSKSLNDQVKYLWLLYKRVLDTPPGSSEWGSITGTLSDQTDLQTALNDKQSNLATTAEVGINGAAETGVALNVYGNVKAQTALLLGTGSVNIQESAADEMLLTASSGVSTSAGLTVGAGFNRTASQTKDVDYTLQPTDYCILADGTTNTVTIDGGNMQGGQVCIIICTDITNLVSVVADNATYNFLTAGSVVTIYKNPNNTKTYITSVFKV